jgi:hypothetical protein
MTSFLAPYRGESIAGAKTVAYTAEPRLGRDFPRKLAWRKRPRRREDGAGGGEACCDRGARAAWRSRRVRGCLGRCSRTVRRGWCMSRQMPKMRPAAQLYGSTGRLGEGATVDG